MPRISSLTGSRPAPAMLTSPIGQGTLTCKECGTTATRYVLGRGAQAARDAARVAGFNKVKGRGWLCIDCEFVPTAATSTTPAP